MELSTKDSTQNPLALLPRDVLVSIMTFFSVEDIKRAFFVNKKWREAVMSDSVWDSLYYRNFGCEKPFESDSDRMFWAVKANNILVTQHLVRRNKELLLARDRRGGFSPLYRAAQAGLLGMVKLLVRLGAPVDCTDGDGSTPFYIACQENRAEVAGFLITQGCNVECAFLGGFTPMYISAEMGHIEVVKLLCESQANVNAVADRGATPLYIASQNGHPEVVEYLLKHGANTDALFNSVYKPLYIASSRNHKEVVALLQKFGATDISKPQLTTE